jgi:putative membrane protein
MVYLEILVRYVHFISIFIIVGTLSSEFVLLKNQLTRAEIKRLAFIDQWYGLSAITLLGAGFTLWFVLGKPSQFYTYNWVFLLKISLFTIIGILSIQPTIFFMKNRKGNPTDVVEIPQMIRKMVAFELILLIFIPLCASLMARGIGYFG